MTTGSPLLAPTSDRPADYLVADRVIDHDHPSVAALADSLAGDHPDPLDYARAAFTFVRDEVAHSADAGHYSTAYRASDVLRERNAICMGKAHLLTALLRAKDIPAGLCYQRFTDDDTPDGFVLHGLVAIRPSDRWSRLDPRGNRPGVDAQFNLDAEQLAWPVDPSRGELDYPTIHPTPPPALLAALHTARPGPGPAVYASLPSEPV